MLHKMSERYSKKEYVLKKREKPHIKHIPGVLIIREVLLILTLGVNR